MKYKVLSEKAKIKIPSNFLVDQFQLSSPLFPVLYITNRNNKKEAKSNNSGVKYFFSYLTALEIFDIRTKRIR